jgi:hypothetical protein
MAAQQDLIRRYVSIFNEPPSDVTKIKHRPKRVNKKKLKAEFVEKHLKQQKQKLFQKVRKENPKYKKPWITRLVNSMLSEKKKELEERFDTEHPDGENTQLVLPSIQDLKPIKQVAQELEMEQRLKKISQHPNNKSKKRRAKGATSFLPDKKRTKKEEKGGQPDGGEKTQLVLPTIQELKPIKQVAQELEIKQRSEKHKATKPTSSLPKKKRTKKEEKEHQMRNIRNFLKKMGFDPNAQYSSGNQGQSGDDGSGDQAQTALNRNRVLIALK